MTEQTQTAQEENKLIAERRAKLEQLREGSKSNGHPNDFKRENKAGDLQAAYGEMTREEIDALGVRVAVAGRLMRRGGPFVGLQDVSGAIQVYMGKPLQKESEAWQLLDIGDIVSASGVLSKSGKGELYVNVEAVENLQILTKSLRPLPDKFHGLADQEMKYRQRYVDLIDPFLRTGRLPYQGLAYRRRNPQHPASAGWRSGYVY